jgi:DNA polymerase delta subunit 4
LISRFDSMLTLNSLCSEYDDVEEILRQFDMNMAYGPCLGITRLERFERSRRLGLNPPMHVKNLLERVGGNPDALWEGRV